MDLSWVQSLCYGLVSGFTAIAPVSARAHQALLLKLFGIRGGMELMDLFVHLGTLAALYLCSRSALTRMRRASALARIPKRKRRRPLDERSMMDRNLLRTMCVPVILALLVYRRASALSGKLLLTALFLLLGGVLLYIPQFLPGSNRDSRTLSRVEGILMGLGGALGIVPGFSSIGAAVSIGSITGVERSFALNMALMMELVMYAGLVVWDIAACIGVSLTFLLVLRCLAAGILAFAVSFFTIRLLRWIAAEFSYTVFALYCIGLALFLFVLNLLA